jgi:nitrite reductase/ring-hydroxylating ferredoxin subunit
MRRRRAASIVPSVTAGGVAERESLVHAANLEKLRESGRLVTAVAGHTIALFLDGDEVRAVDNRCPHMGFPLHRGTCGDGILTCHWHHARFDLETGGTFDPWADDLRTFPVEVADGEIFIDPRPQHDVEAHQRRRLRDGLERDLPLVLAKGVLVVDTRHALRIGIEFGTTYRRDGWGRGLTILACMSNLLPTLDSEDISRAAYHALAAVAEESAAEPARFALRPLPESQAPAETLTRWFRRFVEVRDADGAERCIVSAVRAGASKEELARMLFAAATDHRYLEGGHVLDFTNKAFEALDAAGWDLAETALGSLARGLSEAERMEESNAWRHPVDLIEILEGAFAELPSALAGPRQPWDGRSPLVDVVLGDDPAAIASALVEALRNGASEVDVASTVTLAAALRIARFPTSNEFGDWDTALHTFTFANAVEQGLRRAPSPELVRGVFDAAMSVYLDRFLNVPATRLPVGEGGAVVDDFAPLLDRQQQVDEAGALVASYVRAGGDYAPLQAALAHLLLREDRNFHTIQSIEAVFRQVELLGEGDDATLMLIAAARYLAAHAPTARAENQTFEIARRLQRGERIYEDE